MKKNPACKTRVMLLLLAALTLYTGSSGAAPTLVLEKEKSTYRLDAYLDILEDPEKSISFEDILSSRYEDRFFANRSGTPNFGFTDSNYWVRFKVEDRSGNLDRWMLEFSEVAVDFFELYIPDGKGGYISKPGGDFIPVAEREINDHHYVFNIDLPPDAEKTIYLHMQSGWTIIPLTLYTPESFMKKNAVERMVYGVSYGIIIALTMLNFFVFLGIRDLTFLYYSLYHFSVLILIMILNGVAFQHFWPTSPWHANYMQATAMVFTFFFSAQFIRKYLDLAVNLPKNDKILKIVGVSALVIGVPQHIIEINLAMQIAAVQTVIYTPIVLLIGFQSLRTGYRPARFLVLAWSVLVFGAIIYSMRVTGILPSNLFTIYTLQIGVALEAILLTFALVDRIVTLRREKELANIRTLEAERELTKELETRVIERTKELNEKNRELETANETKDKFFSIVSHDLQGPAGSLAGILKGLETGEWKPTPDTIRICSRGAENLRAHLESLLTWSRAQQGRLKAEPRNFVLMEECAKPALILLAETASEKKITLKHEIEKNLLAYADPMMVQTVLRNMVSNALKFTMPGGKVNVTAQKDGNKIKISVKDNGIGMSPEKISRLFKIGEKGVSTVGTGEELGTGLGLILCKEFVEKNGGMIGVRSEIGDGTLFWFTLPVGSMKKTDKPFAVDIKGQYVLVVDDEEMYRRLAIKTVTMLGGNAEFAVNGKEALERLAAKKFDLVLMDLNMPVMDGFEAAKKISEVYDGSLPVIAVTSLEAEEVEKLSTGIVFDEILAKPVSENALIEACNRMERRSQNS